MAMPGRDTDIYKVTLKSWLYERIKLNETEVEMNRNQVYPGLEWLDANRRVFKLPWVTETHPEWQAFYRLFHEWASREGRQSTDSQKAKRNFRSALNHSKHFKHIEFMDTDLQTGSYKVYQFLSQEEINKSKSRNYSEDSGASQPTPESQDYANTPSNGIMEASPIGEHLMQHVVPVQQLEQYNDLNMDQRYPQQWSQASVQPMNITDQGVGAVTEVETSDNVSLVTMNVVPSLGSEKCNSMLWGALTQAGATLQDVGKCGITVEYNGRTVQHDESFLTDGPCMIIYGDENHVKLVEDLNLRREFPIFPKKIVSLKCPESEAPGLNKILNHMNTGILLWFDAESATIYMMRECLAHVYCFNMHDDKVHREEPQKPLQIKRKEQYVMFSYSKFVDAMIESEFIPDTPKPSDKVEVVIGIQPKPEDRGKNVKGVKIVIQPTGANKILNSEDTSWIQSIKVSSDLSSLDRGLEAHNSPQQQAMEH